MSDATRVKLRNDISWREVGGEIVVLDPGTSMYFAINVTGAAIWSDLTVGADRSALIATILERFEVSPERAAAGIDAFLETLTQKGLLEA